MRHYQFFDFPGSNYPFTLEQAFPVKNDILNLEFLQFFQSIELLGIVVDIGTCGVSSCMRNCKSDGTSKFEYKEYIVFLSH